MGYYIYFLTILFGWNRSCSDATVAVSLINSAYGVNTLKCGSDGIVNCRINPSTIPVSWIVNDTIYATCFPGCSKNQKFHRNYTPTYDYAKGVLKLTVDSVTYNDSSTTFKCNDGSSFDSIIIDVVPAYNEHKTNIYDTDEGKQVEFTTTCVQPGVEFDWFTVKTDSSDRKKYKRGQAKTTNTSSCSNDPDCGGVGTGKVSSVIMIPTVSKGEKHYIEVVVKYKNPLQNMKFRFGETFLIEVPKWKLPCLCIVFLIYFVRWIQHLTSYFAGSLLYTLYHKSPSEISKTTLFIIFLTCIPVIGSFVAVVLSCTKLSKDMKKSCRVFKVPLYYLPLLGPIYTAILLFREQKECCSCGKCKALLFTFSWICDIGIFLWMILACLGQLDIIIELPCCLYGVYALASLIFSWVNFVCLAECLQKQADNKIRNVPKSLCNSCKQQRKKETKAELICLDCNTILCNECTQKHLNGHIAKYETTSYIQTLNENNKIEKEPKLLCASCKELKKESKGELKCIDCNTVLCKKCTQEHLKKHIANNKIENEPNLLCVSCKQLMKESKAELKCIDCNTFLCDECTLEHLKRHIALRTKALVVQTLNEKNKIEKEPKLLCDSCKELKKESKGELKCINCNTVLCKNCTQEHLKKHIDNNKIGNVPKVLCDSCEQLMKESKAELNCLDCYTRLCENCTEEHRKRHTNLKNNNIRNEPKLLCVSCKKQESKAELYCFDCNTVLCEKCALKHLKKSSKRRKKNKIGHKRNKNNIIGNETKLLCDSCKQLQTESRAELICLYCNTCLCDKCTQEHLNGHIALRKEISYGQTQKGSNNAEDKQNCDSCMQMQIESTAEIKCFDCNEVLCEECTEDHLKRHNLLRNNPIYDMNRKSDRFCCSSCENKAESYCLSCDLFLCISCIKNHADDKVLRHCQQETRNTRCQIICKPCQNKGKRASAKYFNSGEKSFVCEDCKSGEGSSKMTAEDETRNTRCQIICKPCQNKGKIGFVNITAVNDRSWQCERCEGNDVHPAECRCMVYNENMCAVCFEEIRRQSILSHNPIKARRNEHAKLCALHSVSGLPVTEHLTQNNIRKVQSDVYCLICHEYLCTRCFFLHLNLKELWQQQQFDTKFVQHTVGQIQPKNHMETIEKRNNVPVAQIFTGCFPVFGIFVIIYTLRKTKKKQEVEVTTLESK